MNARLRAEVGDAACLEEVLRRVFAHFGRAVSVASSLGAEDMVVLDASVGAARTLGFEPVVFLLDTGRLPEETHVHLERVRERYRLAIDVYVPDTLALEGLVRDKGPRSFLASVEERQACCATRKLGPLARALAGQRAWITGLRREQAETRAAIELLEDDPLAPARLKVNPLFDWSLDRVWDYLVRHRVPTHPLHAAGYPSVGCAPCTRAIQPHEDVRAGRWWWETPSHKECGLHPGRRP